MSRLTVRNVSLSFGPRTVLAEVDLDVPAGQRVGLVAPNGVGKSTLLRVLAGELTPDGGTVTSTGPVAHLTQEATVHPGESLIDHLAGRTGVAEAGRRFEAATGALARGEPGAEAAYERAFDHWTATGAADFAERAARTCEELGLPATLLDEQRPLSGGQSARLRLAGILLTRADVLLLDEPTNDLDDEGLAQLEAHVLASRAAVVVVSHDREFLARTTTRIAELDEFTHGITVYGGGWDAYVAELANAKAKAREEYEQYAAKRDNLVQRSRQTREWSKAGVRRNAKSKENDRNIKAGRKEGAENLSAKATTTDRALARLDEVEEPRDPWELRLTLPTAGRGSQIAFTLRDAVISRGEVTLGPVDLTVGAGERWRITGPNGSGKSTLLAALLGRLPLDSGERSQGRSVVVGEVDQVRARFATTTPTLQVVKDATALDEVDVRTLLAKFRVGADAVLRPAASLSPGERTRAGLAVLQAAGTTCLVLDEPTNHLDVAAIEQLEQALESYEGTLLLVTHDRRMADAVGVDHTLDVRTLAR
ncbi:ABC-F family ATP-binding cassette domain-containing protein [Actinosynnema sp. NPDC050436]|uniref:ABC-F family ATP-binding cassette domain-containing protein n=1 Tax=Actinosynnema sp. NPDC050436 TaxID=3155659 RepID=UPI0033F595A7